MKKKLSNKQAEELKRLKDISDNEIDVSDIPEIDWSSPIVGRFYRPVKHPVTVRLDYDVLSWLKSQGAGYQTRINELLRSAMSKSGKRKRRA